MGLGFFCRGAIWGIYTFPSVFSLFSLIKSVGTKKSIAVNGDFNFSVLFWVYLEGLFDTHRYMTLLGYIKIQQNTAKSMVKAARAPPDSVSFCLILYIITLLISQHRH